MMPESTPQKGERATYSSILKEHDVESGQREMRRRLLAKLSSDEFNDGPGPHGVVAHLSAWAALSGDDIPILIDALLGIGDVQTLNLILESPGGDGSQVTKFVDLCRNQCQRFRVIVPHEAKSAATLISLGADEIIMGPSSELGPIDAQIPAVVEGLRRFISAQSFIDARDELLRCYDERKAKKEPVEPILQLLTTLDLPFIVECERSMELGREIGKRLLCEYMFLGKKRKANKAEALVAELSSVKRFKLHVAGIKGSMAKDLGLKVRLCGHDFDLWKTVWEYYTRAQLALRRGGGLKMFETTHDVFFAQVVAND